MKRFLLFVVLISLSLSVTGQAQFDINAYKDFLAKHKDMTYNDLLNLYPAGLFAKKNITDFNSALYSKDVNSKFHLTDKEKMIIGDNGFMVTERLNYNNFICAMYAVYQSDVPLFISSDAILQSLHYSFDKILKNIETNYLMLRLAPLLEKLWQEIPNLEMKSNGVLYLKAMQDMDLYLKVAQNLLSGQTTSLYYSSNQTMYDAIMSNIQLLKPVKLPLFSETDRTLDFSQFTVRGHYNETQELSQYFQSMIWLGRTEIYITSPKTSDPPQTETDLQRQAILSALISQAATDSKAIDIINDMKKILKVFIGSPDNIRIWEVQTAMQNEGISPADLTDSLKWKKYQTELTQLTSANQLYNSQILSSDPTKPDQLIPAASFLLMGQRPILDGFITANVVFDRIIYNSGKVRRMLPKTLDILFSIGNDAAIQLLDNEINHYQYSSNLAALRYLIDGYDNTFWQSTCYNNWLSAIQCLNPPKDRSSLPKFMQTAAWQQKNMNTQLASWAELRHDFILYAKQPYSGSWDTCSYPMVYLEPVPGVYKSISSFAMTAMKVLDSIPSGNFQSALEYLFLLANTNDTLSDIAERELKNENLTSGETNMLCSTLYDNYNQGGGCSGPTWTFDGWYPKLYFENSFTPSTCDGSEDKFVVADVHTAPMDEDGNPVGWVLHAGTGPVNMMVVTADLPDGKKYALTGPVMSYYEYTSTNFKRLTDDEWYKSVDTMGMRPDFVNLYLAGKQGEDRGAYSILFTDVPTEPVIDSKLEIYNFPNPFNNSTTINFKVPTQYSNQNVELSVYDISGIKIRQLINQPMASGNYSTRWNAKDEPGKSVNEGVYLFKLKIGDLEKVGKGNFVK